MSVPVCPITGEPMLDPGQTISRTAAQWVITQTRGLPNLMHQISEALTAHPTATAGTRTQPTSKPPLNLTLFTRVDEHRDTINTWAALLAQHVNPALRFHNADWAMVEAIYREYTMRALTWDHAPQMIDELRHSLHTIERALTPPKTPKLSEGERSYAAGELIDQSLTITAAREAVRLITGHTIPASTIRSWKHRGHITTSGQPPRYHVRTLINLNQHDTRPQT